MADSAGEKLCAWCGVRVRVCECGCVSVTAWGCESMELLHGESETRSEVPRATHYRRVINFINSCFPAVITWFQHWIKNNISHQPNKYKIINLINLRLMDRHDWALKDTITMPWSAGLLTAQNSNVYPKGSTNNSRLFDVTWAACSGIWHFILYSVRILIT